MFIGVLVESFHTSSHRTLTYNNSCTTTDTFSPATTAKPFIPKYYKENCNVVTTSFDINNIVSNIIFTISMPYLSLVYRV